VTQQPAEHSARHHQNSAEPERDDYEDQDRKIFREHTCPSILKSRFRKPGSKVEILPSGIDEVNLENNLMTHQLTKDN
jgi:hypothetical protein